MAGLRLIENDYSPAEAPTPPPPADVFAFPLSPAQEHMWRVDRQAPGNPAYNASFRWEVAGELDVQILERTFNEIIRRHEILRATFADQNGAPVQLIAPSLQIRIGVTDLRALPEAERAAKVDQLSQDEARRGFDLAKSPLIRVGLLRTRERHHVLMLTLHHIVSDGWSIGLMMEELSQIYPALAAGRPSPLAELSIQYGDYVLWRRDQLAGDELTSQLGYWQDQLAGYRRTAVPTDFPRPAERTTSSAIISMMLPTSLTDALKDFNQQHSSTMFITTLAACIMLLRRTTGQADIAVGTPLAGRSQPELESLIGLFVNYVVFRSNVAEDLAFPDFLQSVRETVWQGFANQDVPFESVIASLRGADVPPEPFYLINFVCQREYARASTFVFEFAGLRISTLPSKSQGALYDLNFFMVEREAGWRLSLEYNTDLYGERRANEMLGHFRKLLDGIVEDPARRLSAFSPPSPADPSVRPDRPAETAPAEATGVAAAPSAQVATGSPLDQDDAPEQFRLPASLAQRRFWLLAKLAPQSSALNMPACVRIRGPLSVDTIKRSAQILVDRHETLRTTFAELDGEVAQIVTSAMPVSFSVADVAAAADVTDLIREEAQRRFDLVRGPLVRAKLFRVRRDEHVLVITLHHIIADGWSQSVIQRELWTVYEALLDGAEPNLPPLAIQYGDFAAWQAEWIASDEMRAALRFWEETLAGELPVLDFPAARATGRLPVSRAAMETLVLPDDLVQALKKRCAQESATVFMAMFACFAVLLARYADQDDVLVGSPVANRRPETEPLIGPFAGPFALRLNVAGNPTLREVLKRASDVAMDALAHTDLPFEILLERLKVRSVHGRNPLFQFYFLYQTAFLDARQVRDLNITPVPTFSVGTPFELQLAVIERRTGVSAQLDYNPDMFDAPAMRQVLAYFEQILGALVATPDQRFDEIAPPVRTRAPRDLRSAAAAGGEHVAPRNADEARLARIWEKLLGQSPIGVRDDFFQCGGTSVLAAELATAIERELGIRLELSTLIVAPTIEQLAQTLRSPGDGRPGDGGADRQHKYLIPFNPSGTEPPLFCIHGGGGHLLNYQELAAAMPGDQPVYGLRAPDLDGALHALTVEQLAALYVDEIRTVQPHGPYLLCGHSFGGQVAYEMAAQLAAQGEDIRILAILDTINWAYYRRLPAGQRTQFWATYVVERVMRYGRRLRQGGIPAAMHSALFFVTKNARAVAWKLLQIACRVARRPLPGRMRDNILMFDALGRTYDPRPYPGPLLLFRAERRDAEYQHNATLGWELVAKGSITVRHVPGDHLTILTAPNVSRLVEQLIAYRDEAAAASAP
jgi:thioesterase domain-containing protein/non-ribosomal peptide synthetase component F